MAIFVDEVPIGYDRPHCKKQSKNLTYHKAQACLFVPLCYSAETLTGCYLARLSQ